MSDPGRVKMLNGGVQTSPGRAERASAQQQLVVHTVVRMVNTSSLTASPTDSADTYLRFLTVSAAGVNTLRSQPPSLGPHTQRHAAVLGRVVSVARPNR